MAVETSVDRDRLSCRLRTTEDASHGHYGFRVGWIEWDSPFRDSGLRIEDRITGVDGRCYSAGMTRQQRDGAIGQPGEPGYWKAQAVNEERSVALQVLRGSEVVVVEAMLAFERSWRSEGARMLSPTGPMRLDRDGFPSAWGVWYEQEIVDAGGRILDGALHRGGINTRAELEYLGRRAPRVAYLLKNYPGRFATTVADDFARIEACLEGRRYALSETDLAWREIGEQRALRIAECSRAAWDGFRRQRSDVIMPAFPLPDVLDTDARAKVAGHIVELPPIEQEDWLMSAGEAWMCSEGEGGRYFIAAESRAMRGFFLAIERYRRKVHPVVPERYSIIGRIRSDPKMFVRDRQPLPGFELEPVAACAGDGLFVDLAPDAQGACAFAGEHELVDVAWPMPPAEASPMDVLSAFFGFLKLGEEQEWRACFAEWDAALDEGRPWFFAMRPPEDASLSEEWTRCRRLLASKICDLRPVHAWPVHVLFSAVEELLIPEVEQVEVEVDHVGWFEGRYHAFLHAGLHRTWRLQRLQGGPWRIASSSRYGV